MQIFFKKLRSGSNCPFNKCQFFFISLYFVFECNFNTRKPTGNFRTNNFQAKKNYIIFHIIDQGKVSRVPWLALDAWMVTWNYTWTVPLKGFKRNFESCMSRPYKLCLWSFYEINMNGFVFKKMKTIMVSLKKWIMLCVLLASEI